MFFVPAAVPGFVPTSGLPLVVPPNQNAWMLCPMPAIFTTPTAISPAQFQQQLQQAPTPPIHQQEQQQQHRRHHHRQQQPPKNRRNRLPKSLLLYKTELCRSWQESGRCNYASRCQYAHGERELRTPQNSKYRTEPCLSLTKFGFCPFGMNCHFIHEQPRTDHEEQSSLESPISWPSVDSLATNSLNASRISVPTFSITPKRENTTGRLPVFEHITTQRHQ